MERPTPPSAAAYRMLELAEQARREGLLGLQRRLDRLADEPFLRKAVSLVIDGTPGEELERLLEREVNAVRQQLEGSASIFRKAAEVAPAMGLIGTLVGLVQMLSNLQDPASIGPAMAIALLTTFYGAILAYMVFSPLASKLERDTDEQELVQNVYLLGIASIGRKENPRRLEMQINALLPPAHRVSYFD
jgi:chemotaxis protein MotA